MDNLPQPIQAALEAGTLCLWHGCPHVFTVKGAQGGGVTRIVWGEYFNDYALFINGEDYLADEAQLKIFSHVLFQLAAEIGCDVYLEHKKQTRAVFEAAAFDSIAGIEAAA